MTNPRSSGGDLFIVDNSDSEWKVRQYLNDWCDIASHFDIATAYFEIGALLALDGQWQQLDKIRILMGDEVSSRTRRVILEGVKSRLDDSVEEAKRTNDFLTGVPAIAKALQSGKIECRVYSKAKFHAKAYITHARSAVIGSRALVGSSNFTLPGLTANVELNVHIRTEVDALQEWFERYWDDSSDITADLLKVIERHTREFSPFEVYARSLQEYFKGHEETITEWERTKSKIWPLLDQYQREGYQALMKVGGTYTGAFLCDGVGLGKTFVGLMVIERLLHDRKKVALFVPKAANKPVWDAAIKKYLPSVGGLFSDLVVLNHTDLLRGGEYTARLAEITEAVDAVVIDEAHNFRNRGTTGEGPATRPSRYRRLFDLIGDKQVFLLTATPINNSLRDLQHMIELFSRRLPDYFKDAPLGIHSLPGHFRALEKQLDALVDAKRRGTDDENDVTDEEEAKGVLLNDALFRALVVQRSRTYVRKSQLQQNGKAAIFPERDDPAVVPYSLKHTYGPVLTDIEKAFSKEEPLFFLTAYYPLKYYIGDPAKLQDASGAATGELTGFKFQRNRQAQVVRLIRIQLLKRFESSARAFEGSCESLLVKLLAFATKNATEPSEVQQLNMWQAQNASVLARVVANRQAAVASPDDDDEDDHDLVTEDMLDDLLPLSRADFNVQAILGETVLDLSEIARFLEKLQTFTPAHDDKLRELLKLLTTEPGLQDHKVLVFSEYMDTARYLKDQLIKAGIAGVDEVDSGVKRDRGEILEQFAPYYNGTTSTALATKKLPETRVLIATDVLSEGLNLQDATFLINYDLHWNPVRLMQRIGRVDRRMSPEIEKAIARDHPDRAAIRGRVRYWNFLPPNELEMLLNIYGTLARKTLKISKVFGIEGKKLLRPDDDYDALKEFEHAYEGDLTTDEEMHLALQQLLKDDPGLEARLNALPDHIFSGKQRQAASAAKPLLGQAASAAKATAAGDGASGARAHLIGAEGNAVFLCYALPGLDRSVELPPDAPGWESWTEAAGKTGWYLYDLTTGNVLENASEIFASIRCEPSAPRRTVITKETLVDARKKVDNHIKNTYLKQANAPIGVNPTLKAWMELS